MIKHIISPSIDINRQYISELIQKYDVIPTLHILRSNFSENMNMDISDVVLRVILWQLTHSLEAIEDNTSITYNDMNMVQNICNGNKNTTVRTMARHFTLGVDSLVRYVEA